MDESVPEAAESPLRDLCSPDLVMRLSWEQWLTIEAPYRHRSFATQEVVRRYSRNGYEWDIHGTLYRPEQEVNPNIAFVLFHGGAGSERELYETPDGRKGLGAVLAAQGFCCIAVTFPGHYPAGGEWKEPVDRRMPVYLFDRQLSSDEIRDRNRKCTYNTIVAGAALLADATLGGRKLLSFGHSTGGPMAVSLNRFLTAATVAGIVGWASGGPDGWYGEWVKWVSRKIDKIENPENISRRTLESFRAAGYEDPIELCPWGDATGYMKWGDRFKSQMKTGLCDNQHSAHFEALRQCADETGLPVTEFVDHLYDPEPDWLSRTGVLLLVGENDRNHWRIGPQQLEIFMGEKFAQRANRAKVVVVPKYGHFGYVSLHNEKIAYTWLAALKRGFFEDPRI